MLCRRDLSATYRSPANGSDGVNLPGHSVKLKPGTVFFHLPHRTASLECGDGGGSAKSGTGHQKQSPRGPCLTWMGASSMTTSTTSATSTEANTCAFLFFLSFFGLSVALLAWGVGIAIATVWAAASVDFLSFLDFLESSSYGFNIGLGPGRRWPP